jgi:putative MFS transporter
MTPSVSHRTNSIASRSLTAVPYEDMPLGRFHLRVAVASTGGVFSDGFGLGIIGIALGLATSELRLDPLWLGLLGGAALAGLFLGALLTGLWADRHGRRPVFAYNMLLLALLSALQYFVRSPPELLVLRLAIGFLLGTDYVVSKALLTEFTPRRFRGRILSVLSVAWAGGYTSAYFVGYALSSGAPDAWRSMLLVSALPCALILTLRLTMPESPLWLADHGYPDRAAAVVAAKFGRWVQPPVPVPPGATGRGRWRQLASVTWRRRTIVACTFFTCQVVPYFAVGTFVGRVLDALHVSSARAGGLIYNVALLCGAVLGLVVVDRLSRRAFLVGSFVVAGLAMLGLTAIVEPPPVLTIALFATVAGVLSAASNLVYVYLPELFPTDLRASGIGLAIAASRVGSAASTFLLPLVVASFGVRVALGACVAVLAVGGLVCWAWAPETKQAPLTASAAAP